VGITTRPFDAPSAVQVSHMSATSMVDDITRRARAGRFERQGVHLVQQHLPVSAVNRYIALKALPKHRLQTLELLSKHLGLLEQPYADVDRPTWRCSFSRPARAWDSAARLLERLAHTPTRRATAPRL
jgi:hypothetical protein